jgi:hypothetical protein
MASRGRGPDQCRQAQAQELAYKRKHGCAGESRYLDVLRPRRGRAPLDPEARPGVRGTPPLAHALAAESAAQDLAYKRAHG